MKIGDKVVIERKRKIGESSDNTNRIKHGKIVAILPTFCVVLIDKGYRECYSEKELKLDVN